MEPQFQHDCNSCRFLGRVTTADLGGRPTAYDLYVCPQHGRPTVIARYGDEGPDYNSGICLAEHYPALAIALDRALALGFIQKNPQAYIWREKPKYENETHLQK